MYALASLRCPLGSAAFAWQAWDNVPCQGVDVCYGVPPVSLGLRYFCVGGVGQCALPRGPTYTLSSFRCPLGSAAFAWQAWGNVRCHGVGCTASRPSGVPGSPPLLRGRRGTLCSHSFTRTHSFIHSFIHSLTHSLTHALMHSLTRSITHTLTHSLTHSPTHPPTHSLTHSFTHLCMHIHTHTHKLTHHDPSITLILPLPFLLSYAQSKSREVGNMWGYPVLYFDVLWLRRVEK